MSNILVPSSFMFIQSPTLIFMSSFSNNDSIINSQVESQIVHTTTQSNAIPSLCDCSPKKVEQILTDPYQTTSNYSKKVFLGGIPIELTKS